VRAHGTEVRQYRRRIMVGTPRCTLAGLLTAGALLLSGCGQATPSAAPARATTWSQTAAASGGPPEDGTAIETVYDWFRAWNARDCDRYQSFFQRPDRNCAHSTPPSEWQPVADVRCLPTSMSTARHTRVTCSWTAPPDRTRLGGSFWSVDLSQRPDHTWQIYDHGEG
jgi:hypothetical protein